MTTAVLLQEKIFGLYVFDSGVECVIVQQNRAENRTFGVEILRHGAFESGFGRHSDSFVFAFYSLYSKLARGAQVRRASR